MCVGRGVPSAASWEGEQRGQVDGDVPAEQGTLVFVGGRVHTAVVDVDGERNILDVDTHPMYNSGLCQFFQFMSV